MTAYLELRQDNECTFIPFASLSRISVDARRRTVTIRQYGCVNGTTFNGVDNTSEVKDLLRAAEVINSKDKESCLIKRE